MEITSSFIRALIAEIVTISLKKKLGLTDAGFSINKLEVKDHEDSIEIKTELGLQVNKSDILKLIRGIMQ